MRSSARLESPLDQLNPGVHAIVRAMRGDRELQRRLTLLGLVRGTVVEVLQNRRHGAMLVRARDTLIALGREEARNILVETTA